MYQGSVQYPWQEWREEETEETETCVLSHQGAVSMEEEGAGHRVFGFATVQGSPDLDH